MSQSKSRQLVTFALLVGAVVFGIVLSGTLGVATPGYSTPGPQAPSPLVPGTGRTTGFADLADAVAPAVVSIDATTIDRNPRGGQRREVDPFEFFFGPRRPRGNEGEGEPGEEREPREFRSDAGGSGFVISGDGLVVTNNHVIEGATQITVHLEGRDYRAELKGTDPSTDLALLKIEADQPFKYLSLGDSDSLRVGDWVMAIGNPLLLDRTVTVGVVSAKGRSIGITGDTAFENFIQTDAAINRGNSGGPLVNTSGEVIGIATAMNWGAENIGFAVPVSTLKSVLPQLRDTGRVSRGYLGVRVGNLDFESAQAFGLDRPSGALVQAVDPGTPAEKAGLRHGDVVLEVDGRPVEDTRQLIDYVSNKGPGVKVRLTVLRGDKRIEKDVLLEERPGLEEPGESPAEDEAESGIAWLGLRYQDLNPGLRSQHGMPDELRGVWITDVAPSSPLFEESVRPGDVISEVNGQPVDSVAEFEGIVKDAKAGSYLRLYVERVAPRRGGGRSTAFFAIVRVP